VNQLFPARYFSALAAAAALVALSSWSAATPALADQRTSTITMATPTSTPAAGSSSGAILHRPGLIASEPDSAERELDGENARIRQTPTPRPSAGDARRDAPMPLDSQDVPLAGNGAHPKPLDGNPELFVMVDPHGWYADFTITTSDEAYHWLAVCSDGQPNTTDPAQFIYDVCDGVKFAGVEAQKGHQSTFHIDGLHPDTSYIYAVLAVTDGDDVMTWGPFSTQRRTLSWTIDEIYINDDSDDLSDGDLSFKFIMETDNATKEATLKRDAGTDESIYPQVELVSEGDDSAYVTLTVYGFDDDVGCFIICTLDSSGAWGCNDTSSFERACAYTTLAVCDTHQFETVSHVGPYDSWWGYIELRANGSALVFTVYGRVSVLYGS